VKSAASASFWKQYHALSPEAQIQARKAFALWTSDPDHPSLNFKPLKGEAGLCSVRISQKYRVVGVRQGEAVRWVWVGTHNEFDKLF
jgi:hypothetical protein